MAAPNTWSLVEQARCKRDALYRFIHNPLSDERLSFLAAIEAYYRRRFAPNLANTHDQSDADAMNKLWATAHQRSPAGLLAQQFIIWISLAMFEPIYRQLVPPPPDPDSNEVDGALVNRKLFGLFMHEQLKPFVDRVLLHVEKNLPMAAVTLSATYVGSYV